MGGQRDRVSKDQWRRKTIVKSNAKFFLELP